MDNKLIKIGIIGATGMIGKAVYAHLSKEYEIIIFRRNFGKPSSPVSSKLLVYSSPEELTQQLTETALDAIINLAGEPIAGKRWSDRQKQKIRDSRILTTRAVAEAIRIKNQKPRVLINASAIGFYGDTGEQTADEYSPQGNDYLSRVCSDWESEALKAEPEGVRVVLLRLGLVLGKGGALAKMKIPFQRFVGGPIGNGKQWISWIHIGDVTRIIEMCLRNEEIQGPVNCVSPEPVRMSDFAIILGKTMRRPSFFKVPAWVLRMMLGESASLLLNSQKIMPGKLESLCFPFFFRTIEKALNNLLKKQA